MNMNKEKQGPSATYRDVFEPGWRESEAARDQKMAQMMQKIPLIRAGETENDGAYDRACRDPHDNCPTEVAVLKREWRQKSATISVLSKTIEQQTASSEKLRAAAAELLDYLHEPEDGMETKLMQALRDSMA
jgi:hypothetical protein